jgi:thiosulfate dehydrogenase
MASKRQPHRLTSETMSRHFRQWAVRTALACIALGIAGCGLFKKDSVQTSGASVSKAVAWAEPDPSKIPAGPEGDSIRAGRLIFNQTSRYAASYVGNKLSCTDCHLGGGMVAYASPMVGMPGIFPMYNTRARKVISLEDRVQECFTRSENGHPLQYNGPEMIAVVSYIHWLSIGQVDGKPFAGRGFVKLPLLKADSVNGQKIYTDHCAACHGRDGAGKPPILPAVWGPDSYNDGAGMSQLPKMAAFVQHNMPQNNPGTLTAQESYDVAAYINGKPRPKFNPDYSGY